MNARLTELPVDALIDDLSATLATHPLVLLDAPPGSGKSTRVPPGLLAAPWLASQRILMLEPRRIAARALAEWIAAARGEKPGETIGYRIRNESRMGPHTRIEIVTEAILTRRLRDDPGLEGIGLVIFDEHHERHLHTDLGLALCREVQTHLRPDLRLLVMSATLDRGRLDACLGRPPVLHCEGRAFDVEIVHSPPVRNQPVEGSVAAVARRALHETHGDVLVFLPGIAEIRRTATLLDGALDEGIAILPLHGQLDAAAQHRALAPSPPGRRKLILATSIAQTSLTLDGITAVVDSGLARLPRFDPVSGMSRLVTQTVSRAAATQRAGRAGRTGPGRCYRIWSEHHTLPAHDPPEILATDLAPLALDLAAWGTTDPATLALPDPPPPAAWSQARDLLSALGALDDVGRITPHGRRMADFGMHPRLAHMCLAAEDQGSRALACDLAALIEERPLPARPADETDCDLAHRLREATVGSPRQPQQSAALRRFHDTRRQYRRRLGLPERCPTADPSQAGALLALAWPERVARRRALASGRFLSAGGRGLWLPTRDPLHTSEWLAVAEVADETREARILLAAPIDSTRIEKLFAAHIVSAARIAWDEEAQAVRATLRRSLGAIALDERPLDDVEPELLRAALLDGVRRQGMTVLPWNPAAADLRARMAFLHALDPALCPDVSDAHLGRCLEEWLAPALQGQRRLSDLAALDLGGLLLNYAGHRVRSALDTLAPGHVTLPSGIRARIDYHERPPVLAATVQQLFGLEDTPRVAGGRIPLVLHILSPARRPMQITSDLRGFWKGSYTEVRKQLRARYPKHAWPEDPSTALAGRGSCDRSR